jgi:hypothetical protein
VRARRGLGCGARVCGCQQAHAATDAPPCGVHTTLIAAAAVCARTHARAGRRQCAHSLRCAPTHPPIHPHPPTRTHTHPHAPTRTHPRTHAPTHDRNQAAAQAAVAAATAAAAAGPQLRALLTEPSWQAVLGAQFDKPYMQASPRTHR